MPEKEAGAHGGRHGGGRKRAMLSVSAVTCVSGSVRTCVLHGRNRESNHVHENADIAVEFGRGLHNGVSGGTV